MTKEDIKDRSLGLIFSELPSDSVGGNIRDYVIFETTIDNGLNPVFVLSEIYEDLNLKDINELYGELTEFGVEIMNQTADDVFEENNKNKGSIWET